MVIVKKDLDYLQTLQQLEKHIKIPIQKKVTSYTSALTVYERALLHNKHRIDVMVTIAMRNKSKAPSKSEITIFSSLPKTRDRSHKPRPAKDEMQTEGEGFTFDFPARPSKDPLSP